MTQDEQRKVKRIKQFLCQKLVDGEVSVALIKEAEKSLASEGERANYLQAEAAKQALEWWESVKDLPLSGQVLSE